MIFLHISLPVFMAQWHNPLLLWLSFEEGGVIESNEKRRYNLSMSHWVRLWQWAYIGKLLKTAVDGLPVETVLVTAAVFVDTGYLQGIWGVWRYGGQLATVGRLTENTQQHQCLNLSWSYLLTFSLHKTEIQKTYWQMSLFSKHLI